MEQNAQKDIQDRRGKPRTICHYPAMVRGRDPNGKKYEERGELANLSATGLYLSLKRSIDLGEKLFVTIHLTNSIEEEEPPRLATTGIVMRTEPQPDGACGIAIQFQSYRFL
jgi:hypothetical protein